MSNKFVKGRGINYAFYICSGYCPKCEQYGQLELWCALLGDLVYSCKHTEFIEGYRFTVKRCWF